MLVQPMVLYVFNYFQHTLQFRQFNDLFIVIRLFIYNSMSDFTLFIYFCALERFVVVLRIKQ